MRVDTKSSTDAADVLKLSLMENGMEEVGRFSAKSVVLSSGAVEIGSTFRFRVNASALYYRFDCSSVSPHSGVYCSNCEFPIAGKRLCCAHCAGVNFCEKCENENLSNTLHDVNHVWLQVRRPLPSESRIPRLFSQSLYAVPKDVATSVGAPMVSDAVDADADLGAAVHVDTKCSLCGVSPIIGVRFRCAICPNTDLCSTCEGNPTSAHDRFHYLIKVRKPVLQQKSLLQANLRSFNDSNNATGNWYGFQFTVTPHYSRAHELQVLLEQQEELKRQVAVLLNKPSNRMATQLVEVINQECEKLTSEPEDKDDGGQYDPFGGMFSGRRGGRGYVFVCYSQHQIRICS